LIFSRLLAALLCQSRPYAGLPGSLSAWFIVGTEHGDGSAAIRWGFSAFAVVSGAAILLGYATADGAFRALGVCLAAMLLGYAMVQVPRQRLGGISGDLIGYALQVCEVCACFGLLFVGL
jgi:cobalamin synthase